MVDLFALIFLVASLFMLAGRSIINTIILLTVQALALCLIAFYLGLSSQETNWHMVIVGGLTLVVKVIILPWVFYKLVYKVNLHREVSLSVGLVSSILIGLLLIGLAYGYIVPVLLKDIPVGGHLISAALAGVLLGCFFMISRRSALSQLIGVVAMENGLFLCGVAVTGGMPLIIELGIFFDILVGALVMALMTYQINDTFETIDTKFLNKLKG